MVGLTGALAVVGLTAGPVLAGGPSPTARGGRLDVSRPAFPRVRGWCFNPAEGRPPIRRSGRKVVRRTWSCAGRRPASSWVMSTSSARICVPDSPARTPQVGGTCSSPSATTSAS